MPWIAALTKPNCEAVAALNLQRQGFDCYFPKFSEKLPNKEPRIRPLFSRYIFVHIDRIWYALLGTRGISRVLMGDNGPEPLPDRVIAQLRSREGKDGLYRLDQDPKFSFGAKLKAIKGPFTGQLCICEGMTPHDRVRVLMNMLGMAVPVELDERDLATA